MKKTNYILITPVHNEESLIELVIESVISQTVLPQKWVITDDASTDRTRAIIKKYIKQHSFIMLVPLQREDVESYYSRKTQVFLAAYEKIKDLEFDFIGNLDADITMEPTYYENVLDEFHKNPKLGIASGIFLDKVGNRLQKVPLDKNHSPGALQMFRRECYEAIGGYLPQKYGGDDSCAEITARMHGWDTRSFAEYKVVHHRPVGMGSKAGILTAKFRQGYTEYSLGTHPLFMVAKSLRRMFLERPYFIGSLARLVGFFHACCTREKRRIPQETLHYVRKEQIGRLVSCIFKS